jgi:hypothetical protein
MVAASSVSLLSFVLLVVQVVGQTFTNFTGPGAVVCVGVDYNATPCTPLLPDTCANLPECLDVLVQPTSGLVVITLPCDCATVSDCPAACAFEPLPPASNGTVITGPGYLSCPVADFNDQSDCESVGFNPTCPTLASCDLTSNNTGYLDATAIYIPLNCACYEAVGCPASCEKIDGDLPTLPPLSDATQNFTGVGTVTCPIVDFQRSSKSCVPTIPDNNTAACGTCDYTSSASDVTYQPGDEFISFPLVCECIVMLDCPETCKFAEGATPATPTTAATPTTTASRTNSTSSAMLIGGSSGMWMTVVILVISALAL